MGVEMHACRDALNLVRTAADSKNHATLCISGAPVTHRYAAPGGVLHAPAVQPHKRDGYET